MHSRQLLFSGTAVLVLFSGIAKADGVSLSLGTGSRIWLEGDSTLHRFKAEASGITASFVVKEGPRADDLNALAHSGGVTSAELVLPVAKLSSGESALDKNMWKALKADRQPTIVVHLTAVSTEATGAMKIHGRLSIAGVEREIVIEGQASFGAAGLRIVGSKELLMSEYGVEPPVLMAGLIRVKDRIVVRFDLLVQSGAR